jgi:acyl carrier protein
MSAIRTLSRTEILDLLGVELRLMGVALPETLHEGLSFRGDLGLDSLAIVEFVARMELAFRVEVADQEWRALETLGLVTYYIEKRLGK